MTRIIQKFAIAAAALALVLAFAFFANATPAPERHANYLHALVDLRFARALISNPDSGRIQDPERQAMADIDAAIQELKAAGIDNGKDLNDHPGIDSHLRWIPRLNKAGKVLDNAHDEAAKEEDDPSAQGLQGRILEHIGQARRHVEEAIATEQ